MGFASWQRCCTASSSGRQPNFAALNRGRHWYSAGRPSRWASAHILVLYVLFSALTVSDGQVAERTSGPWNPNFTDLQRFSSRTVTGEGLAGNLLTQVYLELEAKDVLRNMNYTHAAERAKKCLFCLWWPWPLTLTFKLVRARDQTCFPCEFGTNLFRCTQGISNKQKSHSAKNRSLRSSLCAVKMAVKWKS